MIEYKSYNITLKIKGIGTKNIFSSHINFTSEYYPNEVYINEYKTNNVTYCYYLNETDNVIGLIWYDLISSCDHMFYGCSDITEIDLSNFDTSNVENMQSMFHGCSLLTSLHFSNFVTSKVKIMQSMFNGCSLLNSLNLSNFNTSQVTRMNNMFSGCSSLTSLNLSNFDTSQVTWMHYMFDGCTKLEYINIINFNEISLGNRYYSYMFNNVPNNIVVCININNIRNKIYPQIENKTSHIEICPNDYIFYNDICILKINEKEIKLSDFKNKIFSNINSFVNTTHCINGTNFIGMALSSDNMDPEEQIKNGISAIDLGNCTEIIKEYYNISKNENLMILNIETKNISNSNNDNYFNLGKNTQLEIYDVSGRELDLSVCKDDIKVMKYIGDVKELKIQSAISLSEQGIDVFNARDAFFNDICHPYDDPDGRDITLNDRRTDIYQNATFCQVGCSYLGMNYNLMVANCKCNSRLIQGEQKNVTENGVSKPEINRFKEFTKSFISNLIDFNFEVLRCYNLALNNKIIIHNIGFFSLFSMFLLQIIFFIIYLIRKIKPIKTYMLNFNDINKPDKTLTNNNNINLGPPIKKIILEKKLIDNNFEDIGSKYQINSDNKIIQENNLRNKLQNNNFYENIKNQFPTIAINNNYFIKGVNYNIDNENEFNSSIKKIGESCSKIKKKHLKKKLSKRKKIKFNKANNMETNPEKIEEIRNKPEIKINENLKSRILNDYEELQDMDYEKAIINDKRNYIKIFWSFLVDSQIILGTFCTQNYLYLFVIKLSFFVFTFQISFFLNALFYTDEYVSDAYHNNGVLDFIVGLPKSIYSFIATFITTNLLKMLSNSKSELTQVINNRKIYDNYMYILNKKLSKLRKKLIVYFILLFLFNIFFTYYVTVFCAVYRNSQKYWFYGCLESFAMDSLISIISCIFISFLRFISIRKRIKCCYVLSNIISSFI